MRSEEIRALMSPVVTEIYDRGDVGLSSVNRERLQDLGFCRRSFNGAESSEIWVREIPNTFRFPRYIAVCTGDDDTGFLFGITDHLLSRQGWKAEEFGNFCYTASFRRPDGTYDDSDVIHFIDDLVSRMIDDGAIELEVMPC